MKQIFLMLSFLLISNQMQAAVVNSDCSELNDVDYIVEPWHQASRMFADNKVRVIHVDTLGEPACCSSRLLLLIEDPNAELGERKCLAVSQDAHKTGFMNLSFKDIQFKKAKSGKVELNIPVSFYNEDATGTPGKVLVEIDLKNASAQVKN